MNDVCALCKMPMVVGKDGVRRHRNADEREACYMMESIFSGARP